jgi:hypothetical protein
MPKKANGDKIAQDNSIERKQLLTDAYKSSHPTDALIRANQQVAKGGFGFYGDSYGGNVFAPPVEFGGYGAFYGTIDPFSNLGRYGYNSPGMQAKDGWVYGRGGTTGIDHMRIAQCVLLYKTEGVVQTVVHLLADFVVESVDIVHPDDTVHKFYQAWQTKVKLKKLLHRMVVDLLITGNVFLWTKLAKLKPENTSDMKKGIAAELIGNELVLTLKDKKLKSDFQRTISVEVDDDEIKKLQTLNDACMNAATAGAVNEVLMASTRNDDATDADPFPKNIDTKIPWGYISLNPLQMQPRGSRFANEHYWVMMLRQRDIAPLSKFMTYRYYSDISTTKVNLPEIFKGKLKPTSFKDPNQQGYAAELQLDETRLSVIQDVTKTDYEEWATPQIYPAHKEVMFKRMMRQGEISAMEAIKHTITLIKLGDTKEGFAPTEAQIERVAAALAGGGQTHHLVWDDLIEGQVLQPNIGNIFDPAKYEQINKDIYSALGVSDTVMSGQGSYANSFLSIKLLLEKLQTIREILEDWLRIELKKIADTMKFKRLPRISWGEMNLRDENTERKLWLDLYDRGIVSDTSMLERFGTDFDIELARQQLEKSVKQENNPDLLKQDKQFTPPVMVKTGPFNRDPFQQQQKIPPKPPAGMKGKPGKGRPVKTGKPQSVKRNTKPRGMGMATSFVKLHAFAQKAVERVTTLVTQAVIDAQKVKDVRSLSKAQKSNLEDMIVWITAALDPGKPLTDDLVYNLMKDSENKAFSDEDCVAIAEAFKVESEDVSSKEDRSELLCNAVAFIRSGLAEVDNESDRITGEGEDISD